MLAVMEYNPSLKQWQWPAHTTSCCAPNSLLETLAYSKLYEFQNLSNCNAEIQKAVKHVSSTKDNNTNNFKIIIVLFEVNKVQGKEQSGKVD